MSHHSHKCLKCGGIWIHADENSGVPGAHDCPHCGGKTEPFAPPARGINFNQPVQAKSTTWKDSLLSALPLFVLLVSAGIAAASIAVYMMREDVK